MDEVIRAIKDEASRAAEKFAEFDQTNTTNDYIAYAAAYMGRAAAGCARNERGNLDPRGMLIKAAALLANAAARV